MTQLPQIAEPVDLASVGNTPVEREIVASDEDRARIAAAWGIAGVDQLTAALAIARRSDGAVRVTGTVTAEIVQDCVVSFQPVRQRLEEPIDSLFLEAGGGFAPSLRSGAEVHIDVAAETPEPVENGILDLSLLVLEHAALAIEPYPRAEGAEIPQEYAGKGVSADESPFAELSQLIDPQKPDSN